MITIPVINCDDSSCVERRLSIFRELEADWVKFDISDGTFTSSVTWNEPEKLSSDFDFDLSEVNSEVHLMVEYPEPEIRRWLAAGVGRIIIHVESDFDFKKVKNFCRDADAELMLSIKPSTSLEALTPYMDDLDYVQLLAVDPGPSGQEMKDNTFHRTEALRERYPDVKIEIDGGVNEKTAKKVKEAGGDIIVASSFIFGADDPKEAFNRLNSI